MFLRKSILKIWSKFTGEHPCRSVISIKLQSNFIEITLRHGCSPVNSLHIFRTPFPRNTSGWLLLKEKGNLNLGEELSTYYWSTTTSRERSKTFAITYLLFLNYRIERRHCVGWCIMIKHGLKNCGRTDSHYFFFIF